MEKISCTVTVSKEQLVRVAKNYAARGVNFNTFAGLVGQLLRDAAEISPTVTKEEINSFKFNFKTVNFFKEVNND